MPFTRIGGQGGLTLSLTSSAGPASYAAGGFDLTPASAGLASITVAIPLTNVTASGYVPTYNPVTGKILVYVVGDEGDPLDEVADTTDLSGEGFGFLVFGTI